MLLAEGIWNCTTLEATSFALKGVPWVQITVRIDDGPSAGRRCVYERDVDARSAKYAAMSMRAVGWSSKTIESLAADCAAWIAKTGGKSTVEIKHVLIGRGKKYDKWIADVAAAEAAGKEPPPQPVWDKANAIGRPLTSARSGEKLVGTALAEANEALARAMADGGTPPPDDAPPPSDDDLPF